MPSPKKPSPKKNVPDQRSKHLPAVALAVMGVCAIATFSHPVPALFVLGVVMITTAVMVLSDADKIWSEYKLHYLARKRKGEYSVWSEPRELYRRLNVYVIWPGVLLLGMASVATSLYLV